MKLCLILFLINSINTQLNLYLDSISVEQLFGITGYQLYFINDNDIRQSALKNPIRVSSDIHFVQLTWNSNDTFYEYNTSTSNEQALLSPILNIIERGIVPRETSKFRLFFPCLSSNRVDCSVLFRFSNSTTNQTSIFVNIKFTKSCRNEILNHSLLTQFSNNNQINDYIFLKESYERYLPSMAIQSIFIYSVIIAFVVFLLVFCTAMCLFCLYRMMKRKKTQQSESLINNDQEHLPLPLSFDVTTLEDVSLYSCSQYDFMKTADEFLLSSAFADCIIDQNRVTLYEILVQGKFGCLYRCSLNDLSNNGSIQNIYGKTINSTSTLSQLNQMLYDCCLFATLKHSNINSPLGIVNKNELIPYPLIIYPYSNKGILKQFIIKNRTSAREHMLSTQELVYMAIHIAKGLHFLHRRKILMKDIGARNCLVMDDLTVKLTDYALSRDLFPQDYNSLPAEISTESRPLKFMAIESINDRRFSTASDVWSYGVLLWELMSRGLQPYADIDPSNLITHLENNHRLIQPINCPDSLFKLMNTCWTLSIDQRPSMSSLLQSLIQFYEQLARFI